MNSARWIAHFCFAVLTLCFLTAVSPLTFAQSGNNSMMMREEIKRPPIVGVADIGLKTDSLASARKFYTGILGLQEAFKIHEPGSSEPLMVAFKINDHQYVEIYPSLKSDSEDRLVHVAFETTNAEQLRRYLGAKGVKVPQKLEPRLDHNLGFSVTDPEGRNIEFVQYVPGSLQEKSFGKFMPAMRISTHMIHTGFIVKSSADEDRFYHDILGFKEFWHGGMTDTRADWIDMRVPDGKDWLEYMQNVKDPENPHTRGVLNHLALGVPNANAAYQELLKRGLLKYAPKQEQPKIGRDGKWQLNLYDPNLTRVELMEPKPVEKPCCSPMLD